MSVSSALGSLWRCGLWGGHDGPILHTPVPFWLCTRGIQSADSQACESYGSKFLAPRDVRELNVSLFRNKRPYLDQKSKRNRFRHSTQCLGRLGIVTQSRFSFLFFSSLFYFILFDSSSSSSSFFFFFDLETKK